MKIGRKYSKILQQDFTLTKCKIDMGAAKDISINGTNIRSDIIIPNKIQTY
jgi:hypothetical protein